jgi:hypothetical protein
VWSAAANWSAQRDAHASGPAVPLASSAGRRLAGAACLGGGLLLVGMCAYQLTRARALAGVQQYDDGVYFASALQLAAGRIPYRDFALVQPPGVPMLMVPVAVLAHLTGSRVGMAIARVVTALVCGADAALAGWLVRRRGVLAAAVAAGLFALFPADYSADRTLLLEPYLVLFLLLGSVLAFAGDEPATRRRLALAGLAFACAGTVKVWAVFPVAALCLVLVVRNRRAAAVVVTWMAAGFAVICGPFIAAAPSQFFRDVIVAQFARTSHAPTPAGQRLAYLDGVLQTTFHVARPALAGSVVAIVLAAVLLATLGIPALRRRATTLELYVLVATVLCVAIMFVPHTFYSHYALLPDAYLALALALGLDRVRLTLRRLVHADASGRGRRAVTAVGAVLAAAAVAGAVVLVPADEGFAARSLHGVGDPGPEIASVVPPGACVLSDAPSVLVSAGRYSTSASCPAVVDPTGLWIAADPSHPPLVAGPRDPALVTGWEQRLAGAGYFVSVTRRSFRIPWDPALERWFDTHYRLIAVDRAFIYENDARPARRAARR